MSIAGHERQELSEAVHIDPHGIDPIPDADRDSTPVQQFWIWAGANIAPINWVLGGIGVSLLGLSLIETIVVVVLGNLVGCAIFGAFCILGHRTGVNQMVLSRSAFGRRGAYVPGVAQLLLTMGWVGVNTWVVLDLTLGVLSEIGIDGGTGLKYVIGFALMAVQVVIAIYGFYLIRTFEKYTVPVAAVVMLAMSVLAWTKSDVAWTDSQVQGVDKLASISQLLTAIGDRLGDLVADLLFGLHALRLAQVQRPAGVLGHRARHVPADGVAGGARRVSGPRWGTDSDPSTLVSAAFGVMAVPVAPADPARADRHQHPQPLLVLAGRAVDRLEDRALEDHGDRGGDRGASCWSRSSSPTASRKSFDQWIVSIVVWISPWAGITLVEYFVLRRGKVDVPALYEPPEKSPYGDINWVAIIALVAGLAAGWAWQFGARRADAGPGGQGAREHRLLVGRRHAGRRRAVLLPRARPRAGNGHDRDALGEMTRIDIPPREGRAVRVAPGSGFRAIDLEGGQFGDLFAFLADDVPEYHAAEHTRVHVDRLFPRPGEHFVTNHRRPILLLEDDETPGIHDMLIAACDPARYTGLGVDGWHASCQENL